MQRKQVHRVSERLRLTYGNQTARMGQKKGTATWGCIQQQIRRKGNIGWEFPSYLGKMGKKNELATLNSLKMIYFPLLKRVM